MAHDQDDDTTIYEVVVNHEEQYSIWPAHREVPDGWRPAGRQGLKAECLAFIGEVWTDMRPLSLRQRMAAAASQPPAPEPPSPPAEPSLVDRLSEGLHPIEFSARPERSASALRERLQQGVVHLRFTDTRGGTELGIRIDPGASDTSRADWESGAGAVRIVGDLTLDYTPVQCVATLDLQTLAGTGSLRRVSPANGQS